MNTKKLLCPKCYQLALIKLDYKLKDTVLIKCLNCKYKENLCLNDYLSSNDKIQNLYKEDSECKIHKQCFYTYCTTCNKHFCKTCIDNHIKKKA